VPAGPKGKPTVSFAGPSIGITKTNADKQLGAWLFLKYMFQPQNLVEFSLRLSYYPPTRSARDLVAKMDAAQVKAINPRLELVMPQFKKGLGFIPMGVREPLFPGWQGVRGTIENMLTAVYTGKTSTDFTATDPEAAAKEGVQRVQKQLDAYGK
jgi:ABC-type glycerol-3-phosphate transport system substrate-binding protein